MTLFTWPDKNLSPSQFVSWGGGGGEAGIGNWIKQSVALSSCIIFLCRWEPSATSLSLLLLFKQQGSKVRVRCHVEKQTNMKQHPCDASRDIKAIKLCGVVARVAQFLLSVAASAFISVNICGTSACCSAAFPRDIIRHRKNKPNKRSARKLYNVLL